MLIAVVVAAVLGALGVFVSWVVGLKRAANAATSKLGAVLDTSAGDLAAEREKSKAQSSAAGVVRSSSADLSARIEELRKRGRGGR